MKMTTYKILIVLVIAVGFSVISCDDKIEDDTKSSEIIIDATHGKLTITGLEDYTGSRITGIATQVGDRKAFLSAQDYSLNYSSNHGFFWVEVINGSATLKVWEHKESDSSDDPITHYYNYIGNDLNVRFTICSDQVKFDNFYPRIGFVTVDFINGEGNGVFEYDPLF